MATVWRAVDLRLDRQVALKCLTAPLSEDPEYLVRFFSEAQQVARLSHPNVVRVLDFGQGDECPYLVMEYVPGGSLVEVETPLEPDRAIELIAAAARGAGAAHAAGMVHRDLKPGNILLTEDGSPKLADFGIAVSRAQERLTATGTAIGSPHYVSPEQASGRPIDPPSDVYSLGVVLYELLTGRRPFEHDNAMALAIAHVEEEPDPPSAHHPGVGPELDRIVMTCLSKDPDARYADGMEMANALEGMRPSAATAASLPAMATATATTVEEVEEAPAVRNVRRAAAISVLAALFLGLLVFGVIALGDGGDEEKAVAESDGENKRPVRTKKSPSSTPTDASVEDADTYTEGDDGAVTTATPTPRATSDREETKTVKDGGRDDDQDDVDNVEEPTPGPTSEPTEEPAPEPTSTP